MVANGDTSAFVYEVAYLLEREDRPGSRPHRQGDTRALARRPGNADLRWMARLRSLLLTGRFDVVHFHLPYTAALGRLVVASLPRAVRPPVVYTEHSLWNRMAVLIKVVNRAGIGLDRSLVVVSQAAHDALPDALKDRARVIVLGVDLSGARTRLAARRDEIRAEVRGELGVPEGDTLVLTVANLRPEKGYDVLLEAARLVDGHHLPIRFAAVGRGPLEGELRERHRALGLDQRFTFLGQRDDVLRLLVGSDVFVLASRQEGLPVVLMEATSVGMPIVATAVGGVPQVLTDGTDGLVVAPGDPVALAAAIERLAADPGLRERLGRAAHERSAMFDVAAACRQIEEIYRRLAGVPR